MRLRIHSARRRLLLTTIAVAVAAVLLTGCNTIQGVGEDITAMGKAGQDIIDKN
jgi:predicted small secreted protein